MYTRILVPLDGSERAERAVPVAERIMRHAGAERRITLLQVVSRPAPLSGAYMPQSPAASWIQRDVAAAQAYLAHVAGWPLLNGLSVETRVEIGGAPAAVILDVAETDGTDLIVINSHGRTGPTRWMLGSVAEHVARHAGVPMLVLRESGPATEHEIVPANQHPAFDQGFPARVLVPLDGSSFAEAALAPAVALTFALSGLGQPAIHLMVVLAPAEADTTRVPEHPALHRMRIYLMRVSDRLRAIYPRLHVSWSIVPGSDTARTLQRLSEPEGEAAATVGGLASGYELIAMATHGHAGISRWARGSATEQMLHHARLPLLVVPPHVADAKKAAHRAEQPVDSVRSAERIHVTAGEAETLWTPLF